MRGVASPPRGGTARYARRVRLEAVGKRYGLRQPWVVRGVSAAVPAGRLIRVAGRNGSGKSTLLRVVAGVSLPSTGKVTGRPHCGYVPERFPGGLPFPGREYLQHLARIHGLRGETGRQRVEEWLERLGAASYADQPLRSMSKGMCQKVALAQALLSSPGLLVLDGAGGVAILAGPAPAAAPRVERVTISLETAEAARVIGQVRAIEGARVRSVQVDGTDVEGTESP